MDKQIIIDEQMENLNNLATQQLKRIEEEKRQIEHIAKTHLVETFDMQREIDKLKSENKHLNDLLNQALKELEKTRETLTEIKEIVENGKRFTERYMITGEQKANVLTYANAILQKISECEGNDD